MYYKTTGTCNEFIRVYKNILSNDEYRKFNEKFNVVGLNRAYQWMPLWQLPKHDRKLHELKIKREEEKFLEWNTPCTEKEYYKSESFPATSEIEVPR
jgi:hypothetical protein